mgnify:CR=1 FL=1
MVKLVLRGLAVVGVVKELVEYLEQLKKNLLGLILIKNFLKITIYVLKKC